MIVVTIISVLAVIAMVAFRKYRIAGRRAEVYSIFAEIRTREEAYRAEFSAYVSTAASEDTFYPAPNNTPQTWAPPAIWGVGGLGVIPGRSQVYCGYNVIAGQPGVAGSLGARGTAWFNVGGAPNQQWWYANASCDNDGLGGVNATFVTSSDNNSVLETNPQM
jgi:type II secretory pathway pseudopilin PulG